MESTRWDICIRKWKQVSYLDYCFCSRVPLLTAWYTLITPITLQLLLSRPENSRLALIASFRNVKLIFDLSGHHCVAWSAPLATKWWLVLYLYLQNIMVFHYLFESQSTRVISLPLYTKSDILEFISFILRSFGVTFVFIYCNLQLFGNAALIIHIFSSANLVIAELVYRHFPANPLIIIEYVSLLAFFNIVVWQQNSHTSHMNPLLVPQPFCTYN